MNVGCVPQPLEQVDEAVDKLGCKVDFLGSLRQLQLGEKDPVYDLVGVASLQCVAHRCGGGGSRKPVMFGLG